MSKTNWANFLTWTRLILALPITLTVLFEARILTLILFFIAGLSDFLDGKIARSTGTSSPSGAILDNRVDTVFALFVVVWLYILFSKIFLIYWLWITLILMLLTISLGLAHKKTGKLTGLHLYSAKAAATTTYLILPVLLLFPSATWFVVVALSFHTICQVESIIYLLKGGKNLDARFFWDD